ncbi:hypothetical protein Ahy_B05g074107 isoform B [Arachis hypogaea]|uniref:Hydroxymethylglutaryl-CoA synthase n=1 Tax=Arachis hypogaea TaxID=3818 RepID=A0A444YXY2_ARAHY|nr:hypothetical protein Ahy_B05g074107 isoform B [Arachis hypogaea]
MASAEQGNFQVSIFFDSISHHLLFLFLSSITLTSYNFPLAPPTPPSPPPPPSSSSSSSSDLQQEALEAHDGASKGKYTIGLGQDCLAFCTEVEDVISMSLTAVSSLLKKYKIDPKQIGRMEVGSETVIDKSKSIKTFLMQLFEESGNTDIEGVDSTNACYGGTAALFNCVNWVESSSWDGRYGLVICADSAVVDGKLSQNCYLMALDSCYKVFCEKFEKLEGKPFSMAEADYFVFHSPYNKLVQKSFGRLYYDDFLRNPSFVDEAARTSLEPYKSLSGDESYNSRDLEKANQQASKKIYDTKVQPSTLIPKEVGNMYTASLYAAFASLLHNENSSLIGKRVVMFSYGSGLTATMFSFKIQEGQGPFTLSNIVTLMDVAGKLKQRVEFPPEKFVETMKLMEHRYGAKDYVTSGDCSNLPAGTFYLTKVDSMYRRFYARKDTTST